MILAVLTWRFEARALRSAAGSRACCELGASRPDFRTARLSSVPGFDYEETEARREASKDLSDSISCKYIIYMCDFTSFLLIFYLYTYYHTYRPIIKAEGTLEFAPGVTERFIEIPILPKRMEEIADKFLLILYDAEGAKFDRQEGGHRESLTQTVMIGVNEADDGASKWLDATFNCDEAGHTRDPSVRVCLAILSHYNNNKNNDNDDDDDKYV